MKKNNNKSIREKFFIYLIIIIIVPFLSTVTLQNIISTRELKKTSIDNTKQIINQVDALTYQFFEDIISLTNMLSENKKIIDFSKGDKSSETKLEIEHMFKTIKNNYLQIAGILIINSNDDYISNELYRRFSNPLITDDWYKKSLEANEYNEDISFFSMPLKRNLASHENYAADEVISITKVIKDDNQDTNSVILLDIKLKSLEDNLKSIKIGNDGFVYILDKNHKIIFAPDNEIVYRIKHEEVLSNGIDGIVLNIKDQLYQSMYKSIPELNWNVIGVFSLSNIYDVVYTLQWNIIFVSITMIIIIVIASKQFDKKITMPILELNKTMKIVESGKLDVKFDYESNDEIGSLGNSFNSMILEVNKLIELVELEHEKTRQAEFRIMQSQINPHFLYNTLDTINWIAKEYNVKDIEDIVMALTKLFRITLNNGKEFISLEDEINHVKSYLIIQKMRYEDLFEYKIDVDEDIKKYSVIKLIMQPLVENAIYHGIKEGSNKGLIEISLKKEEDNLIINVKDNGAGLLPDKVKEINNMFNTRKCVLGFGLYNINQRITHKFGDKYGLKIDSVKNKYTVLTLIHPIIEGGKNEDINSRR